MRNPTRPALLLGVLLGCLLVVGCSQIAKSFGEGVGQKIVYYLEGAEHPGPNSSPQSGVPDPDDFESSLGYRLAVGLNVATWLYFGIRRRWPSIALAIEGPKKPGTEASQ